MYYSTLKFIPSLVILNFDHYKWWSYKCLCPIFFCSLDKCTRISLISCNLFCWFVSSVLEIRSLHMLTSILSLITSHPLIFSLKVLFSFLFFYYAEDWVLYSSNMHSTTELHPCSKSNIFWFSMWLAMLLRMLSLSRSSCVKLLVCLGSLAILILGYALLHYFSSLVT